MVGELGNAFFNLALRVILGIHNKKNCETCHQHGTGMLAKGLTIRHLTEQAYSHETPNSICGRSHGAGGIARSSIPLKRILALLSISSETWNNDVS